MLGCLCSLSGRVSKNLICELGSHLLFWLFSVYLLTCILCPSLPCFVFRKLRPPPPPPRFQLMLEGIFIFHILSGQTLFFAVAVLLRNGHDSSQGASLPFFMEFQSHSLRFLCGKGSPPLLPAGWLTWVSSFILPVHLYAFLSLKYLQVNHLSRSGASWQARRYTYGRV